MSHEIYTITKFEIIAPYTLRLTFDDNVVTTIDFLLMLRGELYGPLRDLEFFNRVSLDKEAGTIVWPNGADFDPAVLHDWDRVGEEMIEMASKWEAREWDSGLKTIQTMTLEQILYFARSLNPSEKIKLMRVLAQDLESYADKIAPLEPFKTYHIYTSFFEPGTAKALKEAREELEAKKQEQEPK